MIWATAVLVGLALVAVRAAPGVPWLSQVATLCGCVLVAVGLMRLVDPRR